MDTNGQILKNFLNLYWLRPETAIWRTLDAIQMKNIAFQKPLLDAGCGDGSFSFTLFSGETSKSFDVYSTISSTKDFFSGKDIHNQNSFVKPKITKKSSLKINVGMDWKSNLLDKAKSYGLYNKLIKHDMNKKFPFEENSFNSVFSNVLYWLKDPIFSLSEINRILKNNGQVIIFVPDKKFQNFLIFNHFLKTKSKWAKILDRGIHDNIKHCYTNQEWKKIFSTSGFEISHHSTHLSKNLIKFWSIGLRPYSPFLIEMANKLDNLERKRIKNRLINELYPLFRSYIDFELSSPSKNNCFHMYVLKPKS
ncbi:methyltransferase domain-containing protein [Nitrosopumilus sp.]|uniref:methyltransferase domain-containing protein n=1 Tax=Nitrosopumilus sp. TaxID=2024843 RepID=UPI002618ABB2|nr:methyltransferase domain-containing protein [Nitrosopumilus sp.]